MSYKKLLASQKVSVEDYRALIRAVNLKTSWLYGGLFSEPVKVRKGRVFKLPEGYLVVSKEREHPDLKELGCVDLGKAYSLSSYRSIYRPDDNPYRLWRVWLYLVGRVIREVRSFLRVCRVEPEQKKAFNRIVKEEARLYLSKLPVRRSTAWKWLRYELRPKLLRVRS